MRLVDVAAFDELRHGVPTPVAADGKQLVLVRWQDEVYAVRNVCPHQTQSFAGGMARRPVRGTREFGEPVIGADPVVVCPWHYWEFDLRTGVCTADPTTRVRRFAVSVEAGRVLVDVETRSPA